MGEVDKKPVWGEGIFISGIEGGWILTGVGGNDIIR
jgi:hypothetical protein